MFGLSFEEIAINEHIIHINAIEKLLIDKKILTEEEIKNALLEQAEKVKNKK